MTVMIPFDQSTNREVFQKYMGKTGGEKKKAKGGNVSAKKESGRGGKGQGRKAR
jgi:hypothetical protein